MGKSRISNNLTRAVVALLLMPLLLMFTAIVLLYIPPIQKFVVERACDFVNKRSEFKLGIETFHLSFPLKATIENVVFSNSSNNIFTGENIEISIRPTALIKGEIELNYLSVENSHINSDTLIDGINIKGNIGNFRTTARNIAIAKEVADIRMLHLSDSNIEIIIGEKEEEADSTENDINWIINLRRGNIDNLNVTLRIPADSLSLRATIEKFAAYDGAVNLGAPLYYLERASLLNGGILYDKGDKEATAAPLDHIALNNILLETGELLYSESRIKADIRNLTLKQGNNLHLTESNILATGDKEKITIEKLLLRTTNGTTAQMSAIVPLTIIKNPEEGFISGELSTHIDKRDLIGFLTPENYSALQQLPDSMLDATIGIKGNLNSLSIERLKAEIPTIVRLSANGTANNLLTPDDIAADICIDGTINNISEIIYAHNIPDSINERQATIGGTFKMQGAQFYTNISIESDSSSLQATAAYNTKEEKFKTNAEIYNLHLKNIIPDIPLHSATLKMEAEGCGTDIFDPRTHYNCNIAIDSIHYDKYRFKAIEFTARQHLSDSEIELYSKSPNLQLEFRADTYIDSTRIDSRAKLNLNKADFQNLGITDAPLNLAFNMNIQAESNLLETHSINIQGNDFKLETNDRTFTPAALNLEASTSPESSFLNIATGDLKIDAALSAGYKKMQKALEEIAAMYNRQLTSKQSIYYVQDFERLLPESNINVECGQKNILSNYLLFNGIRFNNFILNCNLNSNKEINATAQLFALQKEDFTLDTIRIAARQQGETINYFAGVRSSATNPAKENLKFYASLFGNLNNENLKTYFIFRDNNDHIGAKIGLNTRFSPDRIEFHFDPEAILLNHPFSFNKNNYLNIEKESIIRGDIKLTDSNNAGVQLYALYDSIQAQKINLELFDINLQTITKTVPFLPEIGGVVDANINYNNGKRGIFLYGGADGKNISYNNTIIGDENIAFVYSPDDKGAHSINLSMRHYDNKVLSLSGIYKNSTQPLIIGELKLTRFPLKAGNAFIAETGATVNGYLDGVLSIKGPTDDIISNGYIRFDSVYTEIPAVGTRLHLVDDKVEIKANRLLFKNFDIYAKGATPFKINGEVDFNKFTNPKFDLRMQARNYELINAARKRGSMLYGKLFVDINAIISGSLDAINIEGRSTLLGKSNITYVMLDTPLSATNELDGLVEFVNFSDTTNIVKEKSSFNLGNSTLNLNLNIEDGARINADFDEGRNSYIELQGGGNLNLTYTSEIGMNLTGRYTLSNGQMKYSLPIIPLKTFNISNGSYIYWTGDIANPTLNITALERIVSSVTLSEGETQAVAFDVGVVLTNSLNNMGLSFTLSAPENAVVQNELNSMDKETLNKYAAAMLITGTYLGNNGGVSVSNALSSFLDAKINDLAGSAMKSFNINVGITDVENSESGGTYKNYSFSFTKRFWNDRLTVVIGGEVNSGDTPANADNSSFINNVSLEWKISESGNRYLRLFYDKNYESILEGEITETGVGYVYKRKLDNLKELFTFRRKKEPKANYKRE